MVLHNSVSIALYVCGLQCVVVVCLFPNNVPLFFTSRSLFAEESSHYDPVRQDAKGTEGTATEA